MRVFTLSHSTVLCFLRRYLGYGSKLMMRHSRALLLHDLRDFLKLPDEHRIGATLLAPSTPAVPPAGLGARLCP